MVSKVPDEIGPPVSGYVTVPPAVTPSPVMVYCAGVSDAVLPLASV